MKGLFMKNWFVCLSGLMLLVFASCKKNSTSPDSKKGTYNITISGDINKTLKGDVALYGTDTSSDGAMFAVGIGASNVSMNNTSSDASNYLFIGRYGGKPGKGTYEFMNVDGAGSEGFIATGSVNSNIPYYSVSGTLDINESGNSTVGGDFTIQAMGFQQNGNSIDTLNITVQGTFNAVQAPSGSSQ